jgi:hypothetical protein
VINIARNKGPQSLSLGYFSVLNRSQNDLDGNKSREEVAAKERKFFAKDPWNKLPLDRAGTPKLVEFLSQLLGQKARSEVPNIEREIKQKMQTLQDYLTSTPEPIDQNNPSSALPILVASAKALSDEWMYASEGLYSISGKFSTHLSIRLNIFILSYN